MADPNCLLGYSNIVKTGTLTPTDQGGLPAANLQNDQGSADQAWQTTAGVTSASLLIDSGGVSQMWQAFGLFRTNLTSGATVRWRVSANSSMASPTYDSGVVNAGIIPGYLQSVIGLAAPVAGEFAQLDVVDTSNPDTFLNIPLAFAGPCFQPQTNLDYSSTWGRDRQVTETVTRSGAEFPLTQFARRRITLSFQGIRASEAWTAAMEADRVASIAAGNLLFIPDPASATIQYESCFGRFGPKDLAFPYGNADRRSWGGVLTERL